MISDLNLWDMPQLQSTDSTVKTWESIYNTDRAGVLGTSEHGGIFSLKYKMTVVQMGRERGSILYTRVKIENQNHRNSLYIATAQY